jgi:multiple sugar transport system ATP-binding protein
MGDEIFVYLLTGDAAEPQMDIEGDTAEAPQNQLLMSVDPASEIESEEDVEIVLDRERVHLFDTATGDAISHSLEFTPVEPSATETEAEGDD